MPRQFRIAMVAACPLPYPRGTPIRIHRLSNALADRGHDVHVVTYHLGESAGDARYRIHRIPPVPTYRKVSPGPTYQKLLVLDLLLLRRLRQLLHRGGFDLIHGHHYEGLLVALWARPRRRLPIVFDAHTLLETELPFYPLGLLPRFKRRLGRMLDRRLPPRADHVIAVSEPIRDKLLALGSCRPERLSVIGNGVSWERFDGVRRAGPAGGGAATAIYTGNLAPYQGIDLMLRAFAHLARERSGVRLRIVSESSFERYEGLARELRVRDSVEVIRAPFDQVPGHLAAADVALNPRVACDGLPQKLLNYLAAGVPIVSFAGSARLLTDGRNALVVPDGDVAGFARAIGSLLDDPGLGSRLGENARRLVRDELSWEAAAEKVEAVYQRLAP